LTVEELVKGCDIVEYIRQFVSLEFKDGEWWGISPFKKEFTPSFSVNENGLWYDFSSGKGGNVLTFISEFKKINIGFAIQELKKYLSVQDDIVFTQADIIRQIKKYNKKNITKELPSVQELPANYINRYKKVKIQDWENEGIIPEIMDKYGVRWDAYHEAIVFEIRDDSGKLISFKERSMKQGWKELGFPKYQYTHTIGTNYFLWGLYKNKQSCLELKEIILVESEKSVMKLEGWNITNCAAICTSHINELQFKTLVGLGVSVVVALDKDNNSVVFKDEMWRKLKRFCKVYIVTDTMGLLGEKDAPVDKGLSVWKELYNKKKILS
jgi:DNA primase